MGRDSSEDFEDLDRVALPATRSLPWMAGVLTVLAMLSAGTYGDEARVDPKTESLVFEVTCSPEVHDKPIAARVYVMLGPDESSNEPRLGPDWEKPQPFFAVDVKDWKPGVPVRIDSHAAGFPGSLKELEPGRYAIQPVVRLNRDTHRIGNGEGNAYGPVVHADLNPSESHSVALKVDHIVPPRRFRETDRIKLVELPSPKLTAFHHRPITHRAAVILPTEMVNEDHPSRRPTLYIIPGFGGDHLGAARLANEPRMAAGKDFIRVLLDPDCGTGHHVFADSATNGPRGTALVEEFIPYIEKTLPAIADARARLLNGHSSGGWSSLWLQVTYPDFFGGTWSTSPDPVDFRDFQRINLYAAGENMFRDREGKRRPIARKGVTPFLFYDRFSRMDDVIGWGGQLGSFEAVFSPVGPDGEPRKLWDRSTGAVAPEAAKAWEAYDIRLVLERNWPTLGPKLRRKLHVITGSLDTFYLEGAVQLLKGSLSKLGSDAVVEIIPNRDHRTVLDRELAERLDREMKATVSDLYSSRRAASEKVAR